jgi:putative ABC transport system permease protein
VWWLVLQTTRHAPRRLVLAAVAVAFPVAVLAATMLFVDDSVHAMTRRALAPVQVDMRALATSLDVDMAKVDRRLATVPGVRHVDRFGAADVVVGAPGAERRVTARLLAVDPSYFDHHPWVRTKGASRLGRGALLDGALADAFPGATEVSIDLRGDAPPLHLALPVDGQVDTRKASTWFAIPAGDVQGDVAVVPRSLVVDYATFEREVLPALRSVYAGPAAVTNPGLSELPPASLEAHVRLDPAAYPPDPGRAATWSAGMRRTLERKAPDSIIVADNANEPLTEAAVDATSAKIIFFLLGVPGALVAAALGLAAASALAEAHRREDALLRLRGADDVQLVRLTVAQGLLAGIVGTAVGLLVAGVGVSAVVGHVVWRDIAVGRLAFIAVVAVLAGTITTAARLVPIVRSGRRSGIVVERRQVPGRWVPSWRRAHLDVVALVAGLVFLALNIATGGLELSLLAHEAQAQTIALSFYVLLAPVALWIGVTLLVVRGALALLARWSRPDRPQPLTSWPRTALRWLGRRPARTAVALVLGVLAVAFGAEVVTFAATYRSAKEADNQAAFGSDLRVEPATDQPQPPPALGPDVQAATPIRYVGGRAGSDRKTLMVIDPATYTSTVREQPQIVRGGGVDALARQPSGVLVAEEIVNDDGVVPGDTLPVTIFPDDLDLSQKVDLKVVGVFRAFPPNDPFSEMVITPGVLPPGPALPPPDMYLARVAPGATPLGVARQLRRGDTGKTYTVATIDDLRRQEQRSLTALNLDGLGKIEAVGAAIIAAVGVGILGAFLVLERRREAAILRTVGADTRHILTGPAIEGGVAALGSVVIGVPVGIGLGMLAVRVLGLFFTLPPPLVTVPLVPLVVLAVVVLASSALALALALRAVSRLDVAPILREP